MTMNEKIADYITFPKTFEGYRWYKPIIVLILTQIIMLILGAVIVFVFSQVFGMEFITGIFNGGYEALHSAEGILFADLIIILFIPSLYIASKVIKDRPFSSYSSSRGGWNFKLYFKALMIPLVLYIIYLGIDTLIFKPEGTYNFSIPFLIVLFICVPLQSIAEEYGFRGLLMQTLGSWLNMPVLAIVIQAIIFTLLHGYNTIGLLETLVLGLVYGFFALKTNGIEISCALHTANNFTFGLFVMFGLQASTSSPQLGSVISTIVFQIILAAIIYYVGAKTDWFGELPENQQNI